MPSWAWVVTSSSILYFSAHCGFNALMGLSCYTHPHQKSSDVQLFQCPHGLELLPLTSPQGRRYSCFNALMGLSCYARCIYEFKVLFRFNALMGLSCYIIAAVKRQQSKSVSMPSWAWVVTYSTTEEMNAAIVSMPSWAWVVTARISNILNFSWYFLCIPAIYRCILAYLPIFFNQLSKFLRCESPSTFLGTCLSHHSFIIFLVTNTNTLLSGLYLISTCFAFFHMKCRWMCQCPLGLIPHFYWGNSSIK